MLGRPSVYTRMLQKQIVKAKLKSCTADLSNQMKMERNGISLSETFYFNLISEMNARENSVSRRSKVESKKVLLFHIEDFACLNVILLRMWVMLRGI